MTGTASARIVARMWEWMARWNERRKLANGRCTNCDVVLRDDATAPWCSDQCAADYQNRTAF